MGIWHLICALNGMRIAVLSLNPISKPLRLMGLCHVARERCFLHTVKNLAENMQNRLDKLLWVIKLDIGASAVFRLWAR
jgi:hypothetical protein